MKPRTEDEILSRAPITTKFGDKEYSIPLLAVMAQREWRNKLFAELAPILAAFDFKTDGASVANGLTAALLEFPEKLVELVFLYAPDLPRDEILTDATEEQIILAFDQIKALAFPFSPPLMEMRQIFKAVGSQPSANSTN